MSRRLESIAIGACRRLNRNPSALGCSLRSYAHYAPTSSRPRPPLAAPPSPRAALGAPQQRHFRLTTSARDDAATPVPVSAPAASPKVEELFQKVLWLDMVEVHLLAEVINEKMGITLSDVERERGSRGGRRSAADEDAAPAAVVEEKTIFDLRLTGFDKKSKIKVIKEVRAMTSLGLKEAKDLVEGAPATVKKDLQMKDAEEFKAKLEALGATVEIV